MTTHIKNIVLILREFIKAHIEREDFDVPQRYIPRLTQLVEEMESGAFEALPRDQQMKKLRALGAEYFGRGEVFGLLAPKYLELEYEGALERAIKEYFDDLQQ
jgi:hypothetical protein